MGHGRTLPPELVFPTALQMNTDYLSIELNVLNNAPPILTCTEILLQIIVYILVQMHHIHMLILQIVHARDHVFLYFSTIIVV